MKNIFIDFDSTLNNLIEVWVDFTNKVYNTNISSKDILHWDWMSENFPSSDLFWQDKNIYNELVKPREGAVNFIKILKQYFNVVILTTTYNGLEEAKESNIRRYFGDVKVIHSNEKYLHTIGSILIDDKPKTVNDHSNINNCLGILYDENFSFGWGKLTKKNLENNISHKLCIARSYDEILKLITNLPHEYLYNVKRY